jgi:hypothetical protein
MRANSYRAERRSASGTNAVPDRLPLLDLAERSCGDAMFLSGELGDVRLEIHPIEGAHPDDRCCRLYLGALPTLDIYERYRDDVKPFFLTGGFGRREAVRCPDRPAALWRLYVAPRWAGTQKDRQRPTAITRKADGRLVRRRTRAPEHNPGTRRRRRPSRAR